MDEKGAVDTKSDNEVPIIIDPQQDGPAIKIQDDGRVLTSNEATVAINEATIKGICSIIGNMAAKITNMNEIDFTDEETTLLAEVWSPLLPQVSPMAAALVATVAILGGKVALYVLLKKKQEELNGIRTEESGSKVGRGIAKTS